MTEAGAQRRDGRTRDTRAKLEAVALELFATQGFASTTLQQIADRLGLTKAALYYHFPAKDDLVRSLVEPAIRDIDDLLDAASRQPPPPRELLERFFDVNYHHRLVFLALTRAPSGLAEVDAENWVPRLAQQFQRLLGGPDATPEQRIRVVMVVTGLSRSATLLTDIPYEELRASSVAVALETLGLEDG